MPNYVQLNEKGKVTGVSMLRDEENKPELFAIEEYDTSLLGQYWNGTIFEALTLAADKLTITADGADTAVITASMPTIFNTAEFKTENGELIATVPVTNGTASIEITATSPGGIIVTVEGELVKVVAQ